MKAKQVIGIIVAALVVIAVGVTGILGNIFGAKLMGKQSNMSFWEYLMSDDYAAVTELPDTDFVGVLSVVGEIGPGSSSIWETSSGYNHSMSMEYIEQMMYSEYNKGILLYIDSPGGTVYESDELYLKLMEYKEVTGRPIWAYFASEACSGGYYVAMAADYIYANRNGWTGSIGVIISLLNCEGLYEKLGLEEINITSGENKAMGSAGSELTEEQRAILQSLVDEAYDQFVDIVCTGRNMSEEKVRELADGRIYSALQAKQNKLIDEVGSYEQCANAFIEDEGMPENVYFYVPETETSDILSLLYGLISDLKPKSDSQIANEIAESRRNGVLMYYAK